MSYSPNVVARPTTDADGVPMQGHPRGRGFSILSRLARGNEEPTAAVPAVPQHVAPEPAPQPEPEWTAPVLPFERTEPAPRHRRDVDLESERRSS